MGAKIQIMHEINKLAAEKTGHFGSLVDRIYPYCDAMQVIDQNGGLMAWNMHSEGWLVDCL
jgi:hypothetical protein